ncbi:Ig-like domain-containing protein [Microbacterium sp. NPDC055988]|uniref:Ig-like domain-containing protein n=1 Tax=Microbacterium sp. NPDC055988 TaxID=3345671 RepID=UPI0035D5A312
MNFTNKIGRGIAAAGTIAALTATGALAAAPATAAEAHSIVGVPAALAFVPAATPYATLTTMYGSALPGGVTDEFRVYYYDNNKATNGSWTLTAPTGTTFASVRSNGSPTFTISADGKTATSSSSNWGGPTYAGFATLNIPGTAKQGQVFTGGSAVLKNSGGTVVHQGAITAYAKQDIPAVAGSSTPGLLTTAMTIYAGGPDVVSAAGVMTITAPTGTTIDSARLGSGEALSISADRKTATSDSVAFGGDGESVILKLRIDADAKPGETLTGGSAVITAVTGAVVGTADITADVVYPFVIASPGFNTTVGLKGTTFTGTGAPNEEIVVTDMTGTEAGRFTIDSSGAWSIDLTLAEGSNFLVFKTPDHGTTPWRVLAVDQSAEIVLSSPTSGSTVVGPDVVFEGTAEPGETVVIKDAEGNEVGSTTADSETGEFSVSVLLPEGSTSATVEAGTRKAEVDDLTIIAKLAVTSPLPGATVGTHGTEFSGTGQPAAEVEIKTADGKTVLGTTTVGADGTWKSTVTLAEGMPGVVVESGTQSVPVPLEIEDDTAQLVVTSPQQGVEIVGPDVTFIGNGQPGETVVIKDAGGNELGETVIDEDGTWEVVVSLPGGGEVTVEAGDKSVALEDIIVVAPLVITSPSEMDVVRSGVAMTGTAQPFAEVEVRYQGNGQLAGTATADADGNWSTTLTLPRDPAALVVTTGSQSANRNLLIDTTPVVADLTVTSPSAGDAVDSKGVEFTGEGQPGESVVITDKDGSALGETIVDEFGDWKVTLPVPEGSAPLTVTAGDQSVVIDDLTIVDETPAPVFELAVTSPAEGEVVGAGDVPFTGTGTPGASIVITDAEGTVLGETSVDEYGSWQLTLPAQPEGENTVTISDGENDVPFTFVVTEDVESTPLMDPLLGGSIAAGLLAFAGAFGLRRRLSADNA